MSNQIEEQAELLTKMREDWRFQLAERILQLLNEHDAVHIDGITRGSAHMHSAQQDIETIIATELAKQKENWEKNYSLAASVVLTRPDKIKLYEILLDLTDDDSVRQVIQKEKEEGQKVLDRYAHLSSNKPNQDKEEQRETGNV